MLIDIIVLNNKEPMVILIIASIMAILILIYVKNANYYSVKARLDEGYMVVNLRDPYVNNFVSLAKGKKTPLLQFTKF